MINKYVNKYDVATMLLNNIKTNYRVGYIKAKLKKQCEKQKINSNLASWLDQS